jgi:hypothetical protein
METKMPAFPIRSANQLSEFLNPVTPEMATEIIAQANAVEDGTAYAAVYYWTTPAKTKRHAMLIMVTLQIEDDLFAYVHTDEYHPRKDGKADLIYKTDYIAKSYEV